MLLDTIDGFSCKFLGTSDATVKYILFLKNASIQQLSEIKRKLQVKLSAYGQDEQAVVARLARDEVAAAFDAILRFDVSTSRIESIGAHAIQMTTLNLYELELRRPEGTSIGQMHCAFVDNAVPRRGRDAFGPSGAPMFFARALRNFDTDKVALPLFHATADQLGIEL